MKTIVPMNRQAMMNASMRIALTMMTMRKLGSVPEAAPSPSPGAAGNRDDYNFL
jgi:hypothetical protein